MLSATRLIAGFVTLVCCALLALETSHIFRQRQELMDRARADTANLASSLAQHADLTFRTADALLVSTVERLEHDALFDMRSQERLRGWFSQEMRLSPQFVAFAVVDRNGKFFLTTTPTRDEAPSFADRDYFIQHRDHEDAGLIIGKPLKGRVTGDWIIPVTRRFNLPDGSFGGIAIAALHPAYFQRLYEGLELGRHGAVVLASLQGSLLVRRPFVEANVGRDMLQSGIFKRLKESPVGSAEITATTDGMRRLNSYEQGNDYPFVVSVARDVEELLAPWYASAALQIGLVALLIFIVGLLGVIVWRITDQLSIRARTLRETSRRFDAALSNMTQGVCLFDAQKKLVIANSRFREIYSLPETVVAPGTPLIDLLKYQEQQGVHDDRSLDENVQTIPTLAQQSVSTADGRTILIRRTAIEGGGWVATHEDVTEQRQAQAEIAYLAKRDVLTGLANRAQFQERLVEACRRTKRNNDPITVLLLDLDRFKAVNDSLGHQAGDRLLVELARRLNEVVRETDVIARIGGDEFAILQEGGKAQHEGAIALALRIIQAVAAPFDLDGEKVEVGISVGIAMGPEHGSEGTELLKKADLALYDVKANGRNDFRIFDSNFLKAVSHRAEVRNELKKAIDLEQFELHYQKVFDAKTETWVGVEALVRWRHPTKGLIGPDQFIPLAEESGLIIPLGDWIISQACRDAAQLPASIQVAVNLSPVQFRNANLLEVILCALVETGLSPERLELEITETALVENRETYLTIIRQLKNLGVSIALDDFGEGYSSVNYVTVFPFDKIKIDKAFTQAAHDRREFKAVIAACLSMASELSIRVTAEGIESRAQFERMRDAGVDYVQGFLFGRPSSMLALLAEESTSQAVA